ncbi:GNAT family N-acetyltransferase [Streptacidiphilus sp. 4-A2]|nr:GNAT family N-acetyltransferase [Streptacidiphilus sp. 4-A2]
MTAYRRMSFHLETERLRLRPWAGSDAERLRLLHAERGNGTPTAEHTGGLIAKQLRTTETTGIALLPIRLREDASSDGDAGGDFIGYCGLIVGRSTVDEPEIAYELFRQAHGHGYATEAARAVLAAAAATGRQRLWSTVRPGNTPSFRVLEKLGFERHHHTTDDTGEHVWLTRALP